MNSATFAKARATMVRRQLQRRGILNAQVLDAMGRIPREQFMLSEMEGAAYQDCASPIGCEQTISQPYIVALMSEALEIAPPVRVLEIGTGSGYQTAVLAELGAEVWSVERHAELSRQAEQRLRQLGYDHLYFRIGDGSLGWPDQAPFDRIIVTAAAAACPAAVWGQLAEDGLLVGPFGDPEQQWLEVHRKTSAGSPDVKRLCPCRFVPLINAP